MASAARVYKTCPRCRRTFEVDAAFCPNDGTALEAPASAEAADPYLGTILHGDIELRAVAGAGGMGCVYRAHQRGIDRDVAVKILRRELSGNRLLAQRFQREAKIASKLQHPHVVEVYLAGQLPDGALYIVMEYLDGLSLAAALSAAGDKLPLERALGILLQICDAVGEGHARGVIHRDLKPENVMLIRRGATSDWVKVLDFGIAKVSLGEQSMETAAGAIFGTARYISPEGAQGASIGPQSDVYSLAVMLYQLLAGRPPFDAEMPVGLLIKHIHETPPPLRSWPSAADVPESIERIVMANLAKEPHARAADARVLGAMLADAARDAGLSLGPRAGAVDLASSPRIPTVEPTLNDECAPLPAPAQPASPRTVVETPGRSADALAATSAATLHPTVDGVAPRPARRAIEIAVLAFLLGAVVTLFVTQRIGSHADAERADYVRRARLALVAERFVEPPGDNVRELLATGLARWPDDPDLLRVQAGAARALEMRAMAARTGGDVIGARDLAKAAHDLDPTDTTAKLLVSQYEDEIVASMSDAGGDLGGPRVLLDLPATLVQPGSRAELVARILMGHARHPVDRAEFTVTGPGLAAAGVVLHATGTGPYRASFLPPSDGDYTVEFDANVGGAVVRASRALTVRRP